MVYNTRNNKMSELAKLKKQLEKVEKQLEKYRTNVAEFSMTCPRTQRRWKSERNWDYYAQEKFRLQGLIEDKESELVGSNEPTNK